MATFLVLGGTSWVGGEIARIAMARGHDVTCLARGESGEAPEGATFVAADRADPEAYDAVRDRRWDSVVDVSWQPGFVRGAVEALGPGTTHWTYVSSCSVYADQSTGSSEDDPIAAPLHADRADWDAYPEAKAACEAIVGALPRTLVARAGLVIGPGDRSDRHGYWVSRLALAGDEPVLVPDVPDQPTQGIDVRDLAAWLVAKAEDGTTGVFNAVGEQVPYGAMLRASAEAAGFTGDLVPASAEWLVAHGVDHWAGPRSLPVWVPDSHAGMGAEDDARSLAAGLVRRPLAETLRDALAHERERGLDRERRAGLTRDDELALIAELRG